MTPTAQLRILRTSLPNRTVTLPFRAPTCFVVAPQRHVQPCLLHPTRFFATSPCLLAAKRQAVSTVAPYKDGQSRPPSAPASANLSPTAANPPATTRPPPLELPTRTPDMNSFVYLFKTGKAYLTFYKTGLKNTYLNARLIWSLRAAGGIPTDTSSSSSSSSSSAAAVVARPPTTRVPEHGSTTRAYLLLKRRVSHDARRLPFFALVLLVCGEFTPFVVLALPRLVPFTCRIPRQVEGILRKTEERRRRSFVRLGETAQKMQQQGRQTTPRPPTQSSEVVAHIARSMNLVSVLWDHLQAPDAILGSYVLGGRKVRQHLAFLLEDTRLLHQAGGVDALEDAEVVLACADRGIDIMGKEVSQLRTMLRAWMKQVYRRGLPESTDTIALMFLQDSSPQP